MDTTTGEPVPINFCCTTCGKTLRDSPNNRIACSSCLIRIPIPTNTPEEFSRVLHPGNPNSCSFSMGNAVQ